LRAAALLAVGAVGGGTALAVASVPDGSGEIHACVSVTTQGGVLEPSTNASPNITVIDPSANQHCIPPDGTITNQTTLSWNATGPQGPAGVPGTPGATGKTGSPGATGKGLINTFTITPPALKSNAPAVGEVTLGSGRTALTFNVLTSNFAARAKVNTHDITITKKVDQASPKLFQAAVTGMHIKTGTITLRKAGGEDKLLVIKLSDVLISSDQTEASPGKNSAPTETLSLNFAKIEFKYKQQSKTGSSRR
jgi:type VI secretion system Hcp family effector